MKTKAPTAKIQALRQSGTLHPRPGNIQDRLFLEESFFDPQDLTQVRYEMLRRAQRDEMPISTVAASFGVSRPAFYKAQRDFARGGLAGLIPRRRGPKQGHKLTGEFCLCEAYPCGGTGYDNSGAGAEDSEEVFLSGAPQDRRASSGEREKKTEQAIAAERECRRSHPATILTEHYEMLRGYVLARNNSSGLRLGLGALMSRGMAAWMQVAGELVASARSVSLSSTEAARVPQLVLDEVIRLMGSAVMTLVSGGSL